MSIRHRPMRPEHVGECVEIVAADPLQGPRYGSDIFRLCQVWTRLLSCEAFRAVVFEEVSGTNIRVFGCGISTFVSDDFLRELKTPPFRWVGPELTKKVAEGGAPLLSDKQLRESNAADGLNLVVWDGCVRAADTERPEVNNEIVTAFVEQHRGFRLKELVAQPVNPQAWRDMINAGSLCLDPANGRYVGSPDKHSPELSSAPHLFGMTRELALGPFLGSWISALFVHQPPQLGFRPSEQRLLSAALAGGTDEDLADDLCVSVSAVKKTWFSIYDRATAWLPGLIPGNLQWEAPERRRGKEKKQRLLAYVREHPEELRPVPRTPRTGSAGARPDAQIH
jgi:hypothetical protein